MGGLRWSSMKRSRWAAFGATCAVVMGSGGLMSASAAPVSTGSKPVFISITPCRVMDTRPAPETVGPRNTALGAAETHTISVVGNNGNCTGIPTDAVGVSMNVAAVFPTAASFLTVFPSGAPRPLAANLNWVANQAPTSNAVNVLVPADGKVSFFNLAGLVHITADINGYYIDHNHDDRYYTKAQVDAALLLKANTPVTGAEILDGTVAAVDIADNAVGTTKLADNAVTSAKILDATILTADLANNAVTTPKLADNAVTSAKILDATILTADLADNAVTNPKLAANAVTSAKVLDDTAAGGGLNSADINPLNGDADIIDNTITTFDIATNAVDSDEVLDFALTNQDVNVFYAVVNADGTLARSSGGGVTSSRVSAGSYNVDFGRSVASCSWVADTESGIGFTDVFTAGANLVNVHHHSTAAGFPLTDGKIHLQVVC